MFLTRHIWIDVLHRLAECRCEFGRIAVRPHDDAAAEAARLCQRDEDLWKRAAIYSVLARVRSNTDD
jgi:hypothetical protein